ncbi:hypothetical protein BY458DRAFT_522032 [Sporodiniella umbellata]|nr:hypothetical protein BY458DRAFT_522032 [Sporodiniella umbellata]
METRKPIRFSVLKVQLEQLVQQYDVSRRGVIFTRDVLTLIDRFETNKQMVLLSDDQKKAILPYTKSNPDLEMTPDDILHLLKLVCASPQLSLSAPTQTSIQACTAWKRRLSLSNKPRVEPLKHEEEAEELARPTDIAIEQQHTSTQDLARYYRRSLALTQRLKSSEKSLAHMTRDNEDRILQLQTNVDDMHLEVVKQRKEIQEYKGKEQKSLEQISALEHHISQIQRSETDQKQVHLSIKGLFDEKCVETQALQELLKDKEARLVRTESRLSSFQQEVQSLGRERKRLEGLQKDLELELTSSARAHQQLAEQRSENKKLKRMIDSLKTDLDEALLLNENEFNPTQGTWIKSLETELDQEEKLKTVLDEKDYYKSIATEAKEDLDRVQHELEYLKKALKNENQSLVHHLSKLNASLIPPKDPWAQSRVSRRAGKGKKRTVQDYHERLGAIVSTSPLVLPPPPSVMTRKDDRIVTHTVTFALYTVLVYFFGIITSTFLMEGQTDLSAALAAAASAEPKSKVWEIVFYWLQKVLVEPQGLPVS